MYDHMALTRWAHQSEGVLVCLPRTVLVHLAYQYFVGLGGGGFGKPGHVIEAGALAVDCREVAQLHVGAERTPVAGHAPPVQVPDGSSRPACPRMWLMSACVFGWSAPGQGEGSQVLVVTFQVSCQQHGRG